jgi:hypothetical protein
MNKFGNCPLCGKQVAVSSIALSIFMYNGLFSAEIPEWMKWAFVFLGR